MVSIDRFRRHLIAVIRHCIAFQWFTCKHTTSTKITKTEQIRAFEMKMGNSKRNKHFSRWWMEYVCHAKHFHWSLFNPRICIKVKMHCHLHGLLQCFIAHSTLFSGSVCFSPRIWLHFLFSCCWFPPGKLTKHCSVYINIIAEHVLIEPNALQKLNKTR